MPKNSATISPIEARLPPISGVPMETVAVPSSPTASDTEVSPPWLNRVLERRGLPVTDDDRARVTRCDDVATLERWLDLAVTATRASELFDR